MPRQEAQLTRRGQGERAGLALDQIVASARVIGARKLTMQAVADELGVDRKTINHYVGGRQELLRLAAMDAFAEGTKPRAFPHDASWQDACRALANFLVDGLLAAGDFASHVTLDAELVAAMIEPAELLVARMAAAGFDEETSVRALAQIANFSIVFAQDAITAARHDDNTRPKLLARALEIYDRRVGHSATQHPRLTQIVAAGVNTYDRTQLDVTIETFIAGTASQGRRLT